jgi:DNA primase
VIDEIKTRLDIVEVIGEHVSLRKTGRAYLGFCPFHSNTRTPAFTVYPDTQSFYCFGCHAAGSVFDFVMRQKGVDFRGALQELAQRAGVLLQERGPEEQAQDQHRTRLLDLNQAAARYFHYLLVQHRRGQPGRDYVERRDIAPPMIEMFQLGYSMDAWDGLLRYLTERKGFAPEEVAEAGLVIRREQGGWYDRFRGRLMFPIHTLKGEIVGFGGRALGDTLPKYLNTPQTVLFEKSQVLYGLHQARDAIRGADAAVVVEGYIDVITAHQHELPNVVAPLGTALTAGHVALLKRLSRNVYLALDADAAGQRATLRGIQTLQSAPETGEEEAEGEVKPVVTAQGLVRWERDMTLRIIKLPPGQDPDEVIRANPQRWRDLVASAVPVVDFYLEAYTTDLDLADAHHRRTALERLLPVIAQLDAVQRRIYLERLEQMVGVRAELLLGMVHETHQRLERESRQRERESRQREQERSASRPPSPPAEERPSGQAIQRSPAGEQRQVPRPGRSGRFALPDPRLVARGYRAPPPPPDHEDYLMALMLRYPATRVAVETAIAEDLAAFPRAGTMLGSGIDRLLERPENRLLWEAWVNAGSPPLAVLPNIQQQDDPVGPSKWIGELDEFVRAHVATLAALALPTTVEYQHLQDARKSARQLQIAQARHRERMLRYQVAEMEREDSQGEGEGEGEGEGHREHVASLTELYRYLEFLRRPPHGKWYDLRDVVGRGQS